MALLIVFVAAVLCGLSNLFMRKSIDSGGTSQAFLVVQQGLSILVAFLLNPVRTGFYTWNTSIALIGLGAGIILGLMMLSLGKAFEKGPAGLTVAALNASNVVPAIIMVMLFGSAFGHAYHWWNGLGSILVVIGLFWASWQHSSQNSTKFSWAIFTLSAFLFHAFFLVLIEWRALIITPGLPETPLIPFLLESHQTQWFMPMIFVASTTLLTWVFITNQRRFPKPAEISYGIFGGICNGACTFFLIQAAALAQSWENAMLFPTFAVSLIVICNLWGKWLYQETIHWKATAVCLLGLFIGTVDWFHLSLAP